MTHDCLSSVALALHCVYIKHVWIRQLTKMHQSPSTDDKTQSQTLEFIEEFQMSSVIKQQIQISLSTI